MKKFPLSTFDSKNAIHINYIKLPHAVVSVHSFDDNPSIFVASKNTTSYDPTGAPELWDDTIINYAEVTSLESAYIMADYFINN